MIPAASEPVEVHADWLELEAIRTRTGQVSLETFVRGIRRAGSTDALEPDGEDRGSEVSQGVAQDAFSEAERRLVACGVVGSYPFDIEQGLIKLRIGWEESPYILLLLLSKAKPTAGHNGTAVLFERLCTHAAHQYFGGDANNAFALRFGTPRKAPLAKFYQAVDDLCIKLSEGGGCREPSKGRHLGDNGLDVVAWRPFSDARGGKLIAFGQCATGGDDGWKKKLTELQGGSFARKWFRDIPSVDPIRLFFLPHRVPENDWRNTSIDGGIIFDRCRIVACLTNLDPVLLDSCKKNTKRLVKEIVK